ncbi:relaxase/mobilization nuclease domain-containing protein [Roseateles sp. LYH14W]|uniref:Relaxase/mobilization nuclease domain-containing protein n=1 Tax=Pelomonas parva TaxID=3299032 RepID=A0ABW7F605_9BURK
MMDGQRVDAVLVQWGERLFFPQNRIVSPDLPPRLHGSLHVRAESVRRRIEATVVRQAPQVIVKLAGGGRGMRAIAAHFRYISRNGQLEMEDDRGELRTGRDSVHDIVNQWRYGGSLIEDVSSRREAFNILLSLPEGFSPGVIRDAARDFAKASLAGHRYVMVLHEHQASPHVHLVVKAEAVSGERMRPWVGNLRWRETFAEKLRARGADVEATRQSTRGENRNYEVLWRLRAKESGVLRTASEPTRTGENYMKSRAQAMQAWSNIMSALAESQSPQDRSLADHIAGFVRRSPFFREVVGKYDRQADTASQRWPEPSLGRASSRIEPGPEMTR